MAHPPPSALRDLLTGEAAGGVVLMVFGALALLIANSPLAPAYFGALKIEVVGFSILHWINDALMAAFFLLVGLEIKRELLDGQLSTWHRRILPGLAAAGGMIAPALVYVAINASSPATLRGWAVPAATDIAFALGVLALLGSRAPVSLKVFLTAVAIIDDLGAIAIIAAFYTERLSLEWQLFAALALAALWGLNRSGIERLSPYLLIGVALWFVVLKSGVHATLAGVALAFFIPLRASPGRPDDPHSPLHKLEHALHPWVAFVIVPIFGFANAGVRLVEVEWGALANPITLGVAAGLFFGKQVGVFASVYVATRLELADRPEHASLAQIYGVALLCGIGFTMSLFIGLLAFPDSAQAQDAVKAGVLAGSILSAVVGAIVLIVAGRDKR